MTECTKTKMDRAELEKYLQQKFGDKISPVKAETKKIKVQRAFYEQLSRPHRVVHRMGDGRRKIKDTDGMIRYEV